MFFIKNDRKYFSEKIKIALKERDQKTVFKLIETVDGKEIKNHAGFTLLHLSIAMNNYKIANFLIEKGCDINAKDQRGTTPLILAVKLNRSTIFHELLEAKANIFLSDNKGMNALKAIFGTIQKSRKPLVQLLSIYAKKSKLNAKTLALLIWEAEWPIHYAYEFRDLEVIRFMLERGSPVDSRDAEGLIETALYSAVCFGDAECVEILLQHGADLDMRHALGYTPFTRAFFKADILEKLLNRHDVLERFITNGRIESFSNFSRADEKVVELILLKYKINLTLKDREGNSLLHILVQNSKRKVISLISKLNFDVNMRNDHDDTLLHCAAESNNLIGIKMLIDKGAEVSAKNKNGDTPFIVMINSVDFPNADTCEILETYFSREISDENMQNLILKKLKRNTSIYRISPILERMAVMQLEGEAVSSENYCLMNRISGAIDMFEDYLQELGCMKSYKLTENISLFDIIFASEQQLQNYVRNKDIANYYFKIDAICEPYSLPICTVIEERFKFAVIKRYLVQGTIDTLGKSIKQLNYNSSLIENIVKFLGKDDLQRLGMNSPYFKIKKFYIWFRSIYFILFS